MIILASASPRRKELLSRIVSDFVVMPCDDDEVTTYKRPHLYVQALAVRKAENVAAKVKDGDVVLAADTTVCLKGKILNKPVDAAEAERFLAMLSGRKHNVYTGVCVLKKGVWKHIYYCKSVVEFNKLDDEFIKGYVRSGSPLDKAGAYGVQDKGVVKRVIGDYDNVVGLPLGRLAEILGE